MSPELLSIENRPHGKQVRTYLYECGHTHPTVLLTPPKDCLACKQERFALMRPAEEQRRVRALNARSAVERANRAHDYGKRHLICERCFASRAADAKTLTEAHADIFSYRDPFDWFHKDVPRGFRQRGD